ncbi:hypothetical protein F1596_18905, partial [Acinetobacter sp. AB118710]
CGVGCGVTATVEETALGQKVSVEGDAQHPSNFGKLCIKGSNLADTVGLETRVLHPMLGRKPQREVSSWDTATNLIANKFQHYIDQY